MTFFDQADAIFTYTSQQAVEDGILFDIDTIKPDKIPSSFFLKYITSNLLEKGYFQYRCARGVYNGEQGKNPNCRTCEVFLTSNGSLKCLQPSLNIPNIYDLLLQAAQIFKRRAPKDHFASGSIELPTGQKQKIFIAQNETGRFTAMLPEDY